MKTKTNAEKFTTKVISLGNKMLEENNGFFLLTYEKVDGANQGSIFTLQGELGNIAEGLFCAMKTNPALEAVVTSAANALMQSRLLEEKVLSETQASPEGTATTKKTTKITN